MNIPQGFNELADQYNVNRQKTFFPVNTMRLFYLLLARDLTDKHYETVDQVNKVVPKISAYLDACDQHARKHGDSLSGLHEACHSARQAILDVVHTYALQHYLEETWEQSSFPHQEALVRDFDSVKTTPPKVKFWKLLKIRSMCATVYAHSVGAIIRQAPRSEKAISSTHFHPLLDTQHALNQTVTLMMQVNDIADAVCYAKDDLRSGKAPLITLVREHAATPEHVIQFYRHAMINLQTEISRLPLSEPARHHVYQFANLLADVLDGKQPGN